MATERWIMDGEAHQPHLQGLGQGAPLLGGEAGSHLARSPPTHQPVEPPQGASLAQVGLAGRVQSGDDVDPAGPRHDQHAVRAE